MLFLCMAKVIQLKKIKVGAVSYLNTKPFLYGFEKSGLIHDMDLSVDYPAAVARKLQAREIDMALLPVAVLPTLPSYHFVGNYGIACDGEVASVALFSNVPLEQIDTILLDYQSRTSAALLRILCAKHWNISPQFVDTQTDFAERIQGNTAGLIIGDRALAQLSNFPFVYDLGSVWKAFTGLPFVFAAWVSLEQLPSEFVARFNLACAAGIERIDELAFGHHDAYYNLAHYYRNNIHFYLDDEKKEGLDRFLTMMIDA